MLTTNMLSTHGLIVGGTVKARKEAIQEIKYGFDCVGVATMHQEAKAVPTLLQGFIDRLPDQVDETKPCFAVFCEDAKKLFGDEAEYEGYEIEEMLQRVLVKGVRVYFSSTKLMDFPEYVLDEFETKIDVTVIDEDLALVKEEYEGLVKSSKTSKTPSTAKKTSKETEVTEKSKTNVSATQKAIARSASSAVTSVTRSISTNVVNSVLGGKTKSVKDITKQATTTALSSFLRNVINETTKELTKKKK